MTSGSGFRRGLRGHRGYDEEHDAAVIIEDVDEDWTTMLDFVLTPNGVTCVRLQVSVRVTMEARALPAGGINTRLLRSIDPNRIARERVMKELLARRAREPVGQEKRRRSRDQRPKWTDERVAQLCLEYLSCATEAKRSSTRDVYRQLEIQWSERFGPTSEGSLRTRINIARNEGWLKRPGRGRLRAEPGPRLVAWCAAHGLPFTQ